MTLESREKYLVWGLEKKIYEVTSESLIVPKCKEVRKKERKKKTDIDESVSEWHTGWLKEFPVAQME